MNEVEAECTAVKNISDSRRLFIPLDSDTFAALSSQFVLYDLGQPLSVPQADESTFLVTSCVVHTIHRKLT